MDNGTCQPCNFNKIPECAEPCVEKALYLGQSLKECVIDCSDGEFL